MTAATQFRTRKGDWLLFDLVLIVGIIATVVVTLLSAAHVGPVANPRARVLYDATELRSAILNYYTDYGVMPDVSNNAELLETLTGVTPTGGQPPEAIRRNNPRGISFFEFHPTALNDKGELIDPWGTPYRISIEGEATIHIRSAGPDKIFGTADDITGQ